MQRSFQHVDEKIKSRLRSYSEIDKDYWSFRRNGTCERMHTRVQYPAMMVPQMQSELISIIVDATPKVKGIYEPFVGSGTVMLEAMKRGLDFTGQDINPLAILLCKAKSGPFFEEVIKDRIKELLSLIRTDRKSQIEANFARLDKWFQSDVAHELSKIRRAIQKEKYLWCRQFFWMSMAETVRLTSNSRTTTYKLHIRTSKEIYKRNLSPIEIFEGLLNKTLINLSDQKTLLQERGYLHKGRYRGKIQIKLKDSSVAELSSTSPNEHEFLVTSPPYGDNRTTVPYGQFSFLPLQWIDLEDIEDGLDQKWLISSCEIDRRSLGGSLKNASAEASGLLDYSPSLKIVIRKLKKRHGDGDIRVAAFWRDMNYCLQVILSSMKTNAYMIWIVGNRSVSGLQIPMNKIMSELLVSQGAVEVCQVKRLIPSKRMAVRNNTSQTISKEVILVMRKGCSHRT